MKNKTLKVVMASDERYSTYLRTALLSIRALNEDVPISVYTCGNAKYLKGLLPDGIEVKKSIVPQTLRKHLREPSSLDHASTRIAKFASMLDEENIDFDNVIYIDSDTICMTDINKITSLVPINPESNEVYLLLKRPETININQISWLYFKDSSTLSPQEMATLVNETFNTKYSPDALMNIRCFNGGVVYGNSACVRKLSGKWRELYLKMLTGMNHEAFIPNDQLCLWIALDQLQKELIIHELPLEWNFMPGHASKELLLNNNPTPEEIKRTLQGVKILHLAQNKTDMWAQILINEINSKSMPS